MITYIIVLCESARMECVIVRSGNRYSEQRRGIKNRRIFLDAAEHLKAVKLKE